MLVDSTAAVASHTPQPNSFLHHTNLHQLLLELLDLREVELAEDVVHQAGRRAEQLLLLGRGDAVVVVDGVGELGEAVVAVQGLVVVGLGGGVVAELQAVQGDAERAGREKAVL